MHTLADCADCGWAIVPLWPLSITNDRRRYDSFECGEDNTRAVVVVVVVSELVVSSSSFRSRGESAGKQQAATALET